LLYARMLAPPAGTVNQKDTLHSCNVGIRFRHFCGSACFSCRIIAHRSSVSTFAVNRHTGFLSGYSRVITCPLP